MTARRLGRSRKPIAQMSARRIAEQERRAEVVDEVWARDRGECQAKGLVPEVRCWGPLDPHEIIPRSAWVKGYLDPANVTLVCRAHHDWIGSEPDAAHDRGLHGYSYERPDYAR